MMDGQARHSDCVLVPPRFEYPCSHRCAQDSIDIDLWAMTLPVTAAVGSWLARTLSADERARADCIVIAEKRREFIACRGALRWLMGRYTGVSPDAITFTSQRNGKLQLAGACEWSFNLSHTDGLMLVAVSNGVQVGVDVEKIRPIEGAKRIAARYFSAKECESLEVDPASFFRLWTRRESALKAWGIGISQGWDSVRIVETSWETAKAIGPGPHCHVQLLTPRHGYIAALATLDRVVRSPEIRALEINPQLAGAPNGYAKTH